MSPGEIIAAVTLGLTVLGLIVGAVWWMSALFMVVRGIRADLNRINTAHEKNVELLWSGHHEHKRKLDDHEHRITVIEK